jgi:hypothetical protein
LSLPRLESDFAKAAHRFRPECVETCCQALSEGRVAHHYNDVRLNSAIGYITPKDMLAGRQQEIHAERDRKLEEAQKEPQIRRQQAA